MCILFIYVDPNPDEGGYRLIIASNRDEYYRRPAKNAFLCEKTGIIGGRDMEPGREGGMWLGINSKKGGKFKFSALLNITGEKLENACGRGVLVKEFLEKDFSSNEYVDMLQHETKAFNGYNLVALELSKDEANIHSITNTPKIKTEYIGKHILGFGNSPVNVPLSKVNKGKSIFKSIIENSKTKEDLVKGLVELLKNEENFLPDEELQTRAPEAYKQLSSIFVKIGDQYGSRAHSIILVDYNWEIDFIEQALEQPIDPNNFTWLQSNIKSNL
ncbi:unnamed protein product [Brassicogethes aeneus]|uniref:Uncharacterized protein n=1 Tax=Brassicogethes aeneus TaxID=1431903 RepID=A0A9P0FBY1_BRAAE|nr:unnamed protein product [Brassicogethes aeneus]